MKKGAQRADGRFFKIHLIFKSVKSYLAYDTKSCKVDKLALIAVHRDR